MKGISIRQLLFGLAASFFVIPSAYAFNEVTFFASPHQDDWELFMNPNAFDDVRQTSAKIVFIYFTAGDAGRGSGPSGKPYYKARNEGAKRATRFMADEKTATATPTTSTVTVNNHRIERYAYKNTVSYFLNLPDGAENGLGFTGTNFASLYRLYAAQIAELAAVDASATYSSWEDLVNTLEALCRRELLGSGARTSWVNAPDTNTSINPGDHSDHLYTGLVMQEVVSRRMPCLNRALFQGYVTAKNAVNLNTTQRTDESTVFGVQVSGRADFGWAGTWDTAHKSWLGKNYFRTITGNGSVCF